MTRIVVLSGPVGAGKSTLAKRLVDRYAADHIRTQDLLREYAAERGAALPKARRAMQEFGDHVDLATAGRWVADMVAARIAQASETPELTIVDGVRKLEQVDALRSVFPGRVTHIHVHAPDAVLDERYRERGHSTGLQELASYADVAQNETERQIAVLGQDADVSIDTHRCRPQDVETRAAAALRLLGSRVGRHVDVIVGGQYGSEGKGNIAYYLAAEYQILMRVGGPNAGHKVPTDPPFTHRLLPSGTLANSEALLVIGAGATLDLAQLLQEIAECGVEADRLVIDPQAMIIEAEDVAAERGLVSAIGSTGKGGGAAAARRITNRNGGAVPVRLAGDVPDLAAYTGRRTVDLLADAYRRGDRILLEGTQGTDLSLYHGHYPHVTSRDTTVAGCLAEAGIPPSRVRKVIMVVRTYPIRVKSPDDATSGWMGTELDWEEIARRSGLDVEELVGAEIGSVSKKQRRVAEFDWAQLQRSAEINGATDIAVTFADYLHRENRSARRYDQLDQATMQFMDEVERVAGVPVSLIGTRFEKRSVIDRRDW